MDATATTTTTTTTSSACGIETYASKWPEQSRFSIAALVACAITSLESMHIGTLPFKHTYLRKLYRHLGITSRQEQEMLLLLQETGSYQDCNPDVLALPLLPQPDPMDAPEETSSTSSWSTPTPSIAPSALSPASKDIRLEIINDLLYLGLGFEPVVPPRESKRQSHRLSTPPVYSETDAHDFDGTPSTPPPPPIPSPFPRNSTSSHNNTNSPIFGRSKRSPSVSSLSSNSTSSSSSSHKSVKLQPLEYDARARAVIFHMCQYLMLSVDTFVSLEKQIGQHLYFHQQELLEAEREAKAKEEEERQRDEEENRQLELETLYEEEGAVAPPSPVSPTPATGSSFRDSKFWRSITSLGSSSSSPSSSSSSSSSFSNNNLPPLTEPQSPTLPPQSPSQPQRRPSRQLPHQEAKAAQAEAMRHQAQQSMQDLENKKRTWKYVATGLSFAAGATIIGLTGGLAAPLVAAGAGVLLGSGAALLGTTAGIALTIVISGYLFDENEILDAWQPTLQGSLDGRDVYHLTFERKELTALGNAFQRFVATEAVRVVSAQVIQQTVFAALASALVLPFAFMRAGDLIDNPWAMAVDRARKAGYVLADILCQRVQGSRPTTLIGYSTGAIVIWECLQVLAQRQEFGLVDSVVLLGAPINIGEVERWEAASSVVSNRFVNGFSKKDVVLASIYRIHSLGLDVAGLQEVQCVPRIENVDLTDIVGGHLEYRENLNLIVSLLGTL
ncbi:hypothetical protein DFQ27_009358 [Actinomortierella ambigua]|uniref:DUF726-domain-containing protein n=1 Tax=Actinomortierella ambigua TaxID=1343610 RepID=A0A9P6QEL2_9FUNG|nr:hypothetical protein DFQ27_009358 [Actinomortierella ambigua]